MFYRCHKRFKQILRQTADDVKVATPPRPAMLATLLFQASLYAQLYAVLYLTTPPRPACAGRPSLKKEGCREMCHFEAFSVENREMLHINDVIFAEW